MLATDLYKETSFKATHEIETTEEEKFLFSFTSKECSPFFTKYFIARFWKRCRNSLQNSLNLVLYELQPISVVAIAANFTDPNICLSIRPGKIDERDGVQCSYIKVEIL